MWIDTRPINIIDLGTQDATLYAKEMLKDVENTTVQDNTTSEQKIPVQPTLYNTNDEAKKKNQNTKAEALKKKKKKYVDRKKPDS